MDFLEGLGDLIHHLADNHESLLDHVSHALEHGHGLLDHLDHLEHLDVASEHLTDALHGLHEQALLDGLDPGHYLVTDASHHQLHFGESYQFSDENIARTENEVQVAADGTVHREGTYNFARNVGGVPTDKYTASWPYATKEE